MGTGQAVQVQQLSLCLFSASCWLVLCAELLTHSQEAAFHLLNCPIFTQRDGASRAADYGVSCESVQGLCPSL